MNPKESYYAALERQRAGETTIRRRFERSTREEAHDADALDTLYTEIGMKAFDAFHNCLEWIGRIGNRTNSKIDSDRLSDSLRRNMTAIDELKRDSQLIKERMDRIETALASIEAGLRRIDKFTLEAFRTAQALEEKYAHGPTNIEHQDQNAPATRGRLPKEEAARLAIEAAHAMRLQGRRLTLAAVAREAGLKYGQIVYAFGNKEGFLNALEEVGSTSLEMDQAGA